MATDKQPGGAWFRYGLLAWSSARTWAVGSTIVTHDTAMFAEGGDDRGTVWKSLPERHAAVVNNLIVGNVTLHKGRLGWVAGNRLYGPGQSGLHMYSRWTLPEVGKLVEASSQLAGTLAQQPEFVPPERGDVRHNSDRADTTAGVGSLEVETQGKSIDIVPLVRHDYFGLLRLSEDGIQAGAFRDEPPPAEGVTTRLEIEWENGEIERRWQPASFPRSYPVTNSTPCAPLRMQIPAFA